MPNQKKAIDELRAQSPGFLFGRVSRLLRAATESCLSQVHLTIQEFVVLRLVAAASGMTQGELGATFGIDSATMVSLIDSMEGKGWVQRERNPSDRRSYVLRVTPRGLKELSRARKLVEKEQKEFLSPLSDAEWELVRDCLWRLFTANSQNSANQEL